MDTLALESMMAMPREEYSSQVYRIFYFIESHQNTVMVFDPTLPDINRSACTYEYWTSSTYGEYKEEIPNNDSKPRGIGFTMIAFVDSDYDGDTVTQRLTTLFLIFLNGAPIYWYSKKQMSIETSPLGYEFIEMKLCREYIKGLRYKLGMTSITVDVPSFVFGDNQSVLSNTSFPYSK